MVSIVNTRIMLDVAQLMQPDFMISLYVCKHIKRREDISKQKVYSINSQR